MPATRRTADRERPRASRRQASRAAGLGILALSPLMAFSSAAEPADTATGGLTVAIVDLREIPALAPPSPPEERTPAWRTTFGSERQTRPEVRTGIERTALAPVADADVVLIQGVKASAPLRRLFQPRFWRLIVSRRVLSATDPVGFRTVRSDLPFTTAIAVKARRDLRITARTVALALHGAESDGTPDQSGAAATAVRLSDQDGHTVWLASIALPASCTAEDPPCPALAKLDAWRQERKRDGTPVLIGGRMIARPVTDGNPACASHTIESDLAWERRTSAIGENPSEVGTGCISIIRLGK
jgi:hypothetical protein